MHGDKRRFPIASQTAQWKSAGSISGKVVYKVLGSAGFNGAAY